jgi:hypothetical protein
VEAATDTVPLRLSWARWVQVIDGLVRRQGVSPGGEHAYQELYRALLAGCAQDARQADEETRHRLRHLAELVRPWMSLSTLARTEALLLQDLAGRASEAGRALGFRTASPGWLGWLVLLFLGAVALPFGWRLFQSLTSGPEGILRSVEQALRSWSGVFAGGPTFWVSLLGTGGVLVVLWRLSRRRL